MKLWLKDPITHKPSVSLSLLVLSTTLMVSFIIMEAFHAAKSSGLLDELFLTSVSLYFGRRVSFKGGNAVEPEADKSK